MSDALPIFANLPALGFHPDGLGLEVTHAEFQLGAVEGANPLPVVSFAGHYNHGGRSMGFLEFNLPPTVESLDQLKAFLAYYLRGAVTTDEPPWLVEGRALSHLLPWRQQRSAERKDRHGA